MSFGLLKSDEISKYENVLPRWLSGMYYSLNSKPYRTIIGYTFFNLGGLLVNQQA